MEEVFEDEAESDLGKHGAPVGEGYLVRSHSDRLCHWVEEPDLYIVDDLFVKVDVLGGEQEGKTYSR